MRHVGLVLAVVFVTASCSSAATITEDQEFWCRTSQEALAFDFFSETFEELHGVSKIEAKAEFGYEEPAGEQIGSRMTVTQRGGFPDLESQEAWYSSRRFVEACAMVYDEKAQTEAAAGLGTTPGSAPTARSVSRPRRWRRCQ